MYVLCRGNVFSLRSVIVVAAHKVILCLPVFNKLTSVLGSTQRLYLSQGAFKTCLTILTFI